MRKPIHRLTAMHYLIAASLLAALLCAALLAIASLWLGLVGAAVVSALIVALGELDLVEAVSAREPDAAAPGPAPRRTAACGPSCEVRPARPPTRGARRSLNRSSEF